MNLHNASWSFDGIAEEFEAHIRSSVPYYDQGHDLACMYSDFFVTDSSIIYEIGSASGVLSNPIRRAVSDLHISCRLKLAVSCVI